MERVRIKKDDLLNTLRENRLKHIEAYRETFRGWLAKVQQWADEIVAQASEGTLNDTPNCPHRKPISHEDEYDLAIKMLEWEQEMEVWVQEHEFRNYINDDWEWTRSFKSAYSAYTVAG